jgi:hypothetical protein
MCQKIQCNCVLISAPFDICVRFNFSPRCMCTLDIDRHCSVDAGLSSDELQRSPFPVYVFIVLDFKLVLQSSACRHYHTVTIIIYRSLLSSETADGVMFRAVMLRQMTVIYRPIYERLSQLKNDS